LHLVFLNSLLKEPERSKTVYSQEESRQSEFETQLIAFLPQGPEKVKDRKALLARARHKSLASARLLC
jgi:hypothetical protein